MYGPVPPWAVVLSLLILRKIRTLVYIGSVGLRRPWIGVIFINSYEEEKNLIGIGSNYEDWRWSHQWISNRNEVTSIGLRAVVGITW